MVGRLLRKASVIQLKTLLYYCMYRAANGRRPQSYIRRDEYVGLHRADVKHLSTPANLVAALVAGRTKRTKLTAESKTERMKLGFGPLARNIANYPSCRSHLTVLVPRLAASSRALIYSLQTRPPSARPPATFRIRNSIGRHGRRHLYCRLLLLLQTLQPANRKAGKSILAR